MIKRIEKTNICGGCKKPCSRRGFRCRKCFGKYLSGVLKGRKQSKEHIENRAKAIEGAKHWHWKGDKVKYSGLHFWIKRRLPKPSLCEICKKAPPRDLANKGVYDRNLLNWEWLCRKCHMVSDGRLKRFLKLHRYVKKGVKAGDL